MHGENEARLFRFRFDFLPQADNVRIHRASRGKAVITPHLFEQTIATQRFAGLSFSLGAVLARRRTAFTRASSSRMENGLVT